MSKSGPEYWSITTSGPFFRTKKSKLLTEAGFNELGKRLNFLFGGEKYVMPKIGKEAIEIGLEVDKLLYRSSGILCLKKHEERRDGGQYGSVLYNEFYFCSTRRTRNRLGFVLQFFHDDKTEDLSLQSINALLEIESGNKNKNKLIELINAILECKELGQDKDISSKISEAVSKLRKDATPEAATKPVEEYSSLLRSPGFSAAEDDKAKLSEDSGLDEDFDLDESPKLPVTIPPVSTNPGAESNSRNPLAASAPAPASPPPSRLPLPPSPSVKVTVHRSSADSNSFWHGKGRGHDYASVNGVYNQSDLDAIGFNPLTSAGGGGITEDERVKTAMIAVGIMAAVSNFTKSWTRPINPKAICDVIDIAESKGGVGDQRVAAEEMAKDAASEERKNYSLYVRNGHKMVGLYSGRADEGLREKDRTKNPLGMTFWPEEVKDYFRDKAEVGQNITPKEIDDARRYFEAVCAKKKYVMPDVVVPSRQ